MEWISVAIYLAGIATGMIITAIFFRVEDRRIHYMSADEFREFYKAWDELNNEYGVYDTATINEMFDDLGDDEDD